MPQKRGGVHPISQADANTGHGFAILLASIGALRTFGAPAPLTFGVRPSLITTMDELLNNLSSTYWWLSVVVVGLIINLLSSYLKPPLDEIGSKTFHAWKARSDRSRRIYAAKVDALAVAPHTQVISMLRAQSLRAKSNGWSLTAILVLILNQSSIWLGAQPLINANQSGKLVAAGSALSIMFILSIVASMRLAYAAADLESLVMDAQAQAKKSTDKP